MKNDNTSLRDKIRLREFVLSNSGLTDVRVLDLFAGEGHVWNGVRQTFPIASYTAIDKKPRMPGTIKATVSPETVRILPLDGFTVIDVDTYGEPWAIWQELAQKIHRRAAVFLTHGHMSSPAGINVSRAALEMMGIPVYWAFPRQPALSEFAASYCLQKGCVWCNIPFAVRIRLRNVTYYGLICEPKGE